MKLLRMKEGKKEGMRKSIGIGIGIGLRYLQHFGWMNDWIHQKKWIFKNGIGWRKW